MIDKTEYEIGYLNGFYASLKATAFIGSQPGVTVKDIVGGVEDTVELMRRDGDLEYVKSGVDDFLAAAGAAEAAGLGDEFLDFLDSIEANKDNK